MPTGVGRLIALISRAVELIETTALIRELQLRHTSDPYIEQSQRKGTGYL
jgi:hypothetical protein